MTEDAPVGRPAGARRALLFAPHFPPHGNSEAIVAGKLVLALLRRGWWIDVVSSSPQGAGAPRGIWEPLVACTNVAPAQGLSAVSLARVRVAGVLRSGQAIRGMAWATGALEIGIGLARRIGYDLLMSRSQPVEGHLPALVLARRTGLPWLATWNDLEPPVRAPQPYGSGYAARAPWLLERFIRTVVHEAGHHVFPCDGALRYQQRLFPELAGRSDVVPHLALDKPAGSVQEKTAAGVMTICHAGTFDQHRDPKAFFEGLGRFLTDRPGFPVRVVVQGADRGDVLARAVPDGLRAHLDVRPWDDYESTLGLMRRSSLLLLVEAFTNEPIWLSGKFSDYVQCRRPILALTTPGSATDLVLQERGGGERVHPGDTAGVAAALGRVADAWERGGLDEEYPTALLQKSLGEDEVGGRYESIAGKLCGRGAR